MHYDFNVAGLPTRINAKIDLFAIIPVQRFLVERLLCDKKNRLGIMSRRLVGSTAEAVRVVLGKAAPDKLSGRIADFSTIRYPAG